MASKSRWWVISRNRRMVAKSSRVTVVKSQRYPNKCPVISGRWNKHFFSFTERVMPGNFPVNAPGERNSFTNAFHNPFKAMFCGVCDNFTAARLKTVGVRLNASDKRLKVTCIRNGSVGSSCHFVASSRSLTGVRTIATGSRCGAVDSRGELDGSGDALHDRR